MKNFTKRSIVASILIVGTMGYLYGKWLDTSSVRKEAKRKTRQAQAAAAQEEARSQPTTPSIKTIKVHYKNKDKMLDIAIYPNQTIYDLKEHLKDELVTIRGAVLTAKAGLKIRASWITVYDANDNKLPDNQKIDALPKSAFPLEVEVKRPSIPRPSDYY